MRTLAPVAPVQGGNIQVTGHHKSIDAAKKISSTKVFLSECHKILFHSIIVQSVQDSIVVGKDLGNEFVSDVVKLKNLVSAWVIGFEKYVIKQEDTTLNIKLPPNLTLGEAARELSEIDKILSQLIYNDCINGEMKFIGFDRGSSWVGLLLTPAAFAFVCKLVLWLRQVKSINLDIEKKKLEIENLSLDKAIKEQTLSAFDKQGESKTDEAFQDIIEEFNISNDNHEFILRIKSNVKKLEGKVEKGMEIQGPIIEDGKMMLTPDEPKLLDLIKRIEAKSIEAPKDA